MQRQTKNALRSRTRPARPPYHSHLNEAGARYVVIGGMAIIQAGFVRATEDIDLPVDTSIANIARLRQALRSLPDRAVEKMADSDLDRYVVVRVADEIVVDLMKAACGVEYEEDSRMSHDVVIDASGFRSRQRGCCGEPNKHCVTRIGWTWRFSGRSCRRRTCAERNDDRGRRRGPFFARHAAQAPIIPSDSSDGRMMPVASRQSPVASRQSPVASRETVDREVRTDVND